MQSLEAFKIWAEMGCIWQADHPSFFTTQEVEVAWTQKDFSWLKSIPLSVLKKIFFEIFHGEIFEILTKIHFWAGIWTRDLPHPKQNFYP